MPRTKVNCFMYHQGSIFYDRYVEKFGHKPKQWTINSLHELWIKSKARHDKRSDDIWQYINKIAETIPANDKGEHIVYFKQSDQIRAYIIQWSGTFKSHTRQTTNLSEFKTRDEKINFFLSTELNFQMGQELKRLTDLETRLHYSVFEVFWEKVEEELRKKFKNIRPQEAFVIQIGDRKYIIKTEDRYGDYKKFNLVAELNEDFIKI